jgi:hypothetical protein
MSLRRLARALLVCAYAWSNGVGSSWILCYGVDGHVTLEARDCPCCHTSPESSSGSEEARRRVLQSTDGPRGCGTCTDVPLFTATNAHLQPVKVQAKAAPGPVPSGPIAHCAGGPAPGIALVSRPARSPVRADGKLAHLRTVVLRC